MAAGLYLIVTCADCEREFTTEPHKTDPTGWTECRYCGGDAWGAEPWSLSEVDGVDLTIDIARGGAT